MFKQKLYQLIVIGQKTGTSMIISSISESRAEVLYPPLLAIPGNRSLGVDTSSQHYSVCFKVWYWACIPVVWIWFQPIFHILFNLTAEGMQDAAEGMIHWLGRYRVLQPLIDKQMESPPSDKSRSHLPESRRCDAVWTMWGTQSPSPRTPW